jgi:hypothetical protein
LVGHQPGVSNRSAVAIGVSIVWRILEGSSEATGAAGTFWSALFFEVELLIS